MIIAHSKKKILITGCNGFLGSNLIHHFSGLQYEVIGTSLNSDTHHNHIDYIPGDLLDKEFIKKVIKKYKPDVVINTVALVDLDLCEVKEDLAFKTNVSTAINLAEALNNCHSHLIHISTDQLFSGSKSFYSEIDVPAPINVYGKTKLKAENECIQRHTQTTVVRTNIIGWSPANHKETFAEWVFFNLKNNKLINMFTDFYFTPIDVSLFADAIDRVIINPLIGVFNIAGTERCSKYDFGVELSKLFGFDELNIIPSEMKLHNFKAKRQSDLSLSINKFFNATNYRLPNISESLKALKKNLTI